MNASGEASALYDLAMKAHALGDVRLALDYCRRARVVNPDLNAVYTLEARLRLRGEHYSRVLARIIGHLRPRTYLEIGVADGASFRLVAPETIAVGVDPAPRLTAELPPNHRVFAETSDVFFATRDLRVEFGGLPVDLAFIDGMHHFEYALRDFANIERHAAPGSTVLIHDAYPLTRETAERDRRHAFWSGDIWRLIVLLKRHRRDLAVHTIAAPPTGLGLIGRLDPASRVLADGYDRLFREFVSLGYAYLDEDMAGALNLHPNEWPAIVERLDENGRAATSPSDS